MDNAWKAVQDWDGSDGMLMTSSSSGRETPPPCKRSGLAIDHISNDINFCTKKMLYKGVSYEASDQLMIHSTKKLPYEPYTGDCYLVRKEDCPGLPSDTRACYAYRAVHSGEELKIHPSQLNLLYRMVLKS
jgi:hypothetical protein